MSRSNLIRRTDNRATIREVITLEESHQHFLTALIDEVRQRTGRRIDRSQIVQALVDAVLAAEMTEDDIVAAERRRLTHRSLTEGRQEILEEIVRCEEGLRVALVESPIDSAIIREYRRNVRYQKERLKAVEEMLEAQAAARAPQAPLTVVDSVRTPPHPHQQPPVERAVRAAYPGE